MRNFERNALRRGEVVRLAAMLVVGLSTAAAARAATVTFTLAASGGTFNLFAEETGADGFGLASYNLQLAGTLTNVDHNSPAALFATKGAFNGPAGFSLLRSSDSAAPGNPFTIGASQDTVNASAPANLIQGFAQTAGSFTGSGFNVLVAGTDAQTWNAKLKLASGTYTGTAPTLLSNVEVFANVFDTAGAASTKAATFVLCDGTDDSGGCSAIGVPPEITPLNLGASVPDSVVSGTVTATNFPTSWSPTLLNFHYTPGFGATPDSPGLVHEPTWNPATQLFSWNTAKSTRGTYTWDVTATNAFGTGTGTITVEVHEASLIPEPGCSTLGCIAVMSLLAFANRRRVRFH